MNGDLEKELRDLISKVIKVPEEKITPDANLFSDLGVDSLLGVEIFAALDKKYGIDIPDDKLRKTRTLHDIVKLVSDFRK